MSLEIQQSCHYMLDVTFVVKDGFLRFYWIKDLSLYLCH